MLNNNGTSWNTVVIQEYYECSNSTRVEEIRNVLRENASSPNIDFVYLLNERSYEWLEEFAKINPKVRVVIMSCRLTFKMAFEFVNTLPEKLASDVIAMICNNDISFTLPGDNDDRNNKKSFDNMKMIFADNPNTVIALSRWDLIASASKDLIANKNLKLFGWKDSQDTWIFNVTKEKPIKVPNCIDFHFGVLACDNRVAYELDQIGYQLRNVPYDVVTVHHHTSNFRTYSPRYCLPGHRQSIEIERIEGPVIQYKDIIVLHYQKVL
jgi:hypothetical protein